MGATTRTTPDFAELERTATEMRISILEMLAEAGSGHTAGPLGMTEILTALYFHVMRHDPGNPDWDERDYFFLSNGHTAPVLYAAMAHSGYFPLEELRTLRRLGTRLQGHPERISLPGLESTSGPLGSGLSQAAGVAYVHQHIDPDPQRYVYVAMGDGELHEGNIWEAAMFAGHHRLGHLIGVVDRNYIQIDGLTEEVLALDDLSAKWASFGWHVLEVDGNDLRALISAFGTAKAAVHRPSVIIAHTVPGRGVREFEFDHRWHGKVPSADQAREAIDALRAATGETR